MEFPNGIDEKCETGQLIVEINEALAAHGQQLCWFASRVSSNPHNVTVNAGIFPLGVRTGVRGVACVYHLVSWTWTPRVGKTKRSKQYQSLAAAWAEYERRVQANTPERLAAIREAPSFEAEQAALDGAQIVDIRGDGFPTDAGKLWALWPTVTGEAVRIFNNTCRDLGLPFERGCGRCYVVGHEKLKSVYRRLEQQGFAVALDMDATRAYNS